MNIEQLVQMVHLVWIGIVILAWVTYTVSGNAPPAVWLFIAGVVLIILFGVVW